MLVPVSFVLDWLRILARELALWGGVLLLLASVLSFYAGWNRRKRSSLVEETPRRDITGVRSPGTVRVRGEIVAQAEQDIFTSPIKADEDCVLSAWEIEERYDTPKNNSWEKSAWGVQAVPFYLSDGTERVLVDVDDVVVGNETEDVFTPETVLASAGVSVEGLRCEFEAFEVHVETDYEESPPRRIREFLRTTDGVSLGPMTTDLGDAVVDASQRKYHEETLQPGDELSIIGHVAPRRRDVESTGHPHDLVFTQSGEATLRLSEQPFDEVADGGGQLLFGLLTGIVGAGLLAIRYVM